MDNRVHTLKSNNKIHTLKSNNRVFHYVYLIGMIRYTLYILSKIMDNKVHTLKSNNTVVLNVC